LGHLTDGDAPSGLAVLADVLLNRGTADRPVLVHGPTERTGTSWL
jgi:hypothetical protein